MAAAKFVPIPQPELPEEARAEETEVELPVEPEPEPEPEPEVRQPKPTDPDVQRAAIVARCQSEGVPLPMGCHSAERAAARAARMAELNPATMTQPEADARGIVEPAALQEVGLL